MGVPPACLGLAGKSPGQIEVTTRTSVSAIMTAHVPQATTFQNRPLTCSPISSSPVDEEEHEDEDEREQETVQDLREEEDGEERDAGDQDRCRRRGRS